MISFLSFFMGSASWPQTIIFYIVALLDFFGCASIWIFNNKKWLNKVVATFLVLLCLIYTVIVAYTFITDPVLLLNMSFSGVQDQYKSIWIMVTSVGHFAATDIIASRVMLYVFKDYYKIAFWKVLPIFVLLFLWCPIGLLISFVTIGIMELIKRNSAEFIKN